MRDQDLPLRKTMCGTCPFLEGSPYEHLAPALVASALSEASRICHSTGSNAINSKTGKESHLCRGARDVQNRVMASLGVIKEPTDEAWSDKRVEIGMERTVVKDPGEPT